MIAVSRSPLRSVLRHFAVMICLGLGTSGLNSHAADAIKSAERLASGPAVGSEVHAFYVRAVTGPLKNRSVCYVCRNGDRPVMMVFFQGVDPNAVKFMKMLDRVTDAGRAQGLGQVHEDA